MKAPDYWRRGGGGLTSMMLRPLGWLYNVGSQMNQSAATPLKASIPVICVGNVVAGGAGKTPVAIDIGTRLTAAGIKLHYLSRGYGGTETGPHRVDGKFDRADQVGDEPILLSRVAPTWVARDRAQGAHALIEEGAEAIVLDDGLQNPTLAKDMSFCVIDGSYGLGNGRVIPAGPLRESLEDALNKTSVVVLMGDDEADIRSQINSISPQMPVLMATIKPDVSNLNLTSQPVHAFAGIGHPEKFFKTLLKLNCDLKKIIPFPDHHAFSGSEISQMVKEANADGAMLLTTEKDYVRLDPEWQDDVTALHVSLKWQNEALLDALLMPLFSDPA